MRPLIAALLLGACSPSVSDVVLSRGGVAVEVTGDVEAAWSCLPEEAVYLAREEHRVIACSVDDEAPDLYHLGLDIVGVAPLSVAGEVHGENGAPFALWSLVVEHESLIDAETPGFYEVTEGDDAGVASLVLQGLRVEVAWSALYPTVD